MMFNEWGGNDDGLTIYAIFWMTFDLYIKCSAKWHNVDKILKQRSAELHKYIV